MPATCLGVETFEELKSEGYSPEDVSFVSVNGKSCSYSDFAKVAIDVIYDDDYGRQEINAGLIIVMKDGSWFERVEYDGAEGWEYRRRIERPDDGVITRNDLKEEFYA